MGLSLAAAALALGATTAAQAAPITFAFNGGLQSYTALVTSTYDIPALSAQGGGGSDSAGGLGAQAGGSFTLLAG